MYLMGASIMISVDALVAMSVATRSSIDRVSVYSTEISADSRLSIG